MSSINSSNYYSASVGTSGNGMAGLASGMDTESMVEKMLSGTQAMIDKQEGLKQQNVWKQEIYREMIGIINTFQSSFFNSSYGASSSNNLASSSFFNTMMSAVTKGNALKVLSTKSSASVGDIKVAVEQLATKTEMTSDQKMSAGRVISSTKPVSAADINKNFSNILALDVDGAKMNFDLSRAKTTQEVADQINRAFSYPGSSQGKVTAEVFDGKLRLITSDDTVKLKVDTALSSSSALKETGLASFAVTSVKDADGNIIGTMFEGSTPQQDAGYSFNLALDGVSKTISLKDIPADSNGQVTAQAVKQALTDEVRRAFGDYVKVDMQGNDADGYKFSLQLNTPESGHELVVTGVDAGLLGITPGASTSVNGSTKLSDLGAMGDKFSFKINGREFNFTGQDTVSTVLNAVNSSDAGVKLSFSSVADTFKLEATASGAGYDIQIEQTEGDLASVMFGSKVAAGGSVSSGKLATNHIQGTDLANDYKVEKDARSSLTMTVNGVTATFVVDSAAERTKTEVEEQFNKWLKTTFNSKDEQLDSDPAHIRYVGGKLEIDEGYNVSFAATKIDTRDPEAVKNAMKTDLAFAMGFNHKATSNTATADTDVADIYALQGLSVKDASGGAAAKLGDIAQIGGQAVTVNDGRLTISGQSGNIDLTASGLQEIFGKDSITLGDGSMAADAVSKGVDAIIYVNGEKTTRSSNNVTIDGVTVELTQVSATDSSGKLEDTVINTSRDVDTIVKGFTSFVEEYNKMIEKLNGYIDEKATYRSYPPLTAAQRKELGENEVKLWEEKAKEGLVRRDSAVDQFLGEMRIAMYSKPQGSRYALYDIGIETTENYKDKGKLELNETALRNALAADPESVKNLFVDSTEGLAKKLGTAMDRAAKESSGSPGTLVALAGTKRAMDANNMLQVRIKDIETRIKSLKERYERERVRYWNQFSSMESVLSNFNQQSMYLSNQFGMGA